MTGYIDPFWTIEEIKNLPYKKDYHKDSSLIDQYVNVGHLADCVNIWNFFNIDNALPGTTDQFRQLFPELLNVGVAVNKCTPGQYLPLHQDLYGRYQQVFQLGADANIQRIIIMIEDSSPGQILQIGSNTWGSWKAGDWFSWRNKTPHATYNFSMLDRYAWQITGVINVK